MYVMVILHCGLSQHCDAAVMKMLGKMRTLKSGFFFTGDEKSSSLHPVKKS